MPWMTVVYGQQGLMPSVIISHLTSPSRTAPHSGMLSSGARGLLVSMLCYPVSDSKGGLTADMGAIAMNLSQIRGTFAAMIDVKRHTGGICIGHECTEMNIR